MRIIYLIPLFLCACAATLKDFKPNDLKADESAIVGRVKIHYNGRDFTDRCAVCFNSTEGPCFKLEKSGLVAMRLTAGNASLRRVACEDVSQQHYHIQGANFFAVPKAKNYFGDIGIDWKNAGGFKVSTMFGAIGAAIDQAKNDGELRMRVSNRVEETLRELSSLVKEVDTLPINKSLMEIGR